MLISSPVCPRNGLDLKRRIHKILGILHMRSPTKVHKVIPGMVHGDHLSFRKILDQFLFKLLIGKKLQCVFPRKLFSRPWFSSLDDFPHLILDCRKVIFRQILRKKEIIISAVFNLRTNSVLYVFSIELYHCFCKDMRHGMPISL